MKCSGFQGDLWHHGAAVWLLEMKSWKKLREFARFKDKSSQAAGLEPTQDMEEITRGMQDVRYMKIQYEGLQAVSSRVAGRAYGFSEAIQEMATFLIETFAVDGNGDINKVFKEVSKSQSELSRLLHLYAFHVSETLKVPTEGLLSEIGHIEDTKKDYDEKRTVYDHTRLRKSRAKNVKAEAQIEQQLQEFKEQFDELAMFLGCRLHSLEQSRPRHLLTQAVRHHAAQMYLLRQGLGCLDDLDPYINRIVQDRNLDNSLDYLDGGAGEAGSYSKTKDVDESDRSTSPEQETSPKHYVEDHSLTFETRAGSRSAPISPVRFIEANGVNSIHEVMLDGVSKKAPVFSRTKSLLRRKCSRDPGVLHLCSSSSSSVSNKHTAAPVYSVTEPVGSPSPSWIRSPDFSKARRPSPFTHHEQQQQQHKELPSFPSFPRRSHTVSTASSRPKRLIPTSGPLPQPPPCVTLPVDPLYKSGPLSPTPKMSPAVSPSAASPPRVSELHKLPPPPLASSNFAASPGPGSKLAAASVSYSAPLSRPPQVQSHHQQQHQQQALSLSSSVHHHHHHHHHHPSQASPLPPPPLAQAPSPASKNHKAAARKNEERVSPLPL